MQKVDLKYWTRRFLGSEEGSSATEFAIVIPILVPLLFGAIEFGRLTHDYHVVSNGVRDAARYLARVPVSCPGGAPSGPTAAEQTIAKNLALSASYYPTTVPDGEHVLGYWTNANTITVAVQCQANGGYAGVYAGEAFIPRLTVTATVPFNFIFGTLVSANASLNMVASHNEVAIGE
jgi:Flp pilus assembly protein TadG